MISGEGPPPHPALRSSAVILHEAAHALAYARGIKDTSRQGRYHNKHFKTCAEQLGLAVEHDQRQRLVRQQDHRRHRDRLRRPAHRRSPTP